FPQHCWRVTNRVNAKGKQLYLFAEEILLAQTLLKGLHLGREQGTDIGTTCIDEVGNHDLPLEHVRTDRPLQLVRQCERLSRTEVVNGTALLRLTRRVRPGTGQAQQHA